VFILEKYIEYPIDAEEAIDRMESDIRNLAHHPPEQLWRNGDVQDINRGRQPSLSAITQRESS
jgi:hypothetical protein